MSQTIEITREKSLILIKDAVVLLAAMAWRDVIQGLIKYVYPHEHESILGKLTYALIITFCVVIFIIYYEKLSKYEDIKKNKKK